MMRPLGPGSDGRAVAEIGAFCVAPACRGAGKGDSLLDYLGAHKKIAVRHTQPLVCRVAAQEVMSWRPLRHLMCLHAEREARALGMDRLVLLTTRTADWCAWLG